ncbi:DUF4157 domain-containing protein [Streptomyces violascens]|uniref:eCIS core domain-containing protein n=1 Tax=Streptomyces violascens TaxID=67381 RepID=UPI00367F6678
MLRQAGHPWAQPEQHQHGAGCGHQQTGQAGQAAVQRSAVHDVLRSGGRPLDDATRTDMEGRLGADFSNVRIHDDSRAKASAAEIGARAYTSGNHVVIGNGGTDKHTLAHELTHVIQQRQGPVSGADNGSGLKISDPSDRYEREAEANATRAMSGSADVQRAEAQATPARTAPQDSVAVQRALSPNNQPGIGFHSVQGPNGRVEAAMMRTDGSLTGTLPLADPPGYDYVRALNLTNWWIRFHLVNEEAGGRGDANNLVPASKRDNSNYHSQVEVLLKQHVDDARKAQAGHQVFFGVELDYNTPAVGSMRQQLAAANFATSLKVYHFTYDANTGTWTTHHNGAVFPFQDAQPTDTGVAMAATALGLQDLQDRAPGYRWTTDDLAFVQSLGGTQKQKFEELNDKFQSLGAVEAVYAAFHEMTFTIPRPGARLPRAAQSAGSITVAERLPNTAVQALSTALASGMITI